MTRRQWFYLGLVLWIAGTLGHMFLVPSLWWWVFTIPGGFLVGFNGMSVFHAWRERRREKEDQEIRDQMMRYLLTPQNDENR